MSLVQLLRLGIHICLLCILLIGGGTAFGSDERWPAHPVHLIVGFPAGGTADLLARTLADELGRKFSQAIIVENKPGAGGTLAGQFVARAKPDGYTILLASPTSVTIGPAFAEIAVNYSPLEDLEVVARICKYPLVLVTREDSRFNSLADLLDEAKSQSSQINFGSFGIISTSGIAMEELKRLTSINALHVPYSGGSHALNALLSGQIDVLFDTSVTSLPLIRAGRIRALAISSIAPSPYLPDIPTVNNSVAGFSMESWNALMVPTGTPKEIVNVLAVALRTALQSPLVKRVLTTWGAEEVQESRERSKVVLAEELRMYESMAKVHKRKEK